MTSGDEWKQRLGGRRKLVDKVEGRRLIWPATSPENRQVFETWYSGALRIIQDARGSVDTIASFPLVIMYRDGTGVRTNAELGELAGGLAERTVIRHLQQYERLGLIAFERGWRRSPRTKKPIETRAIRLCWPGKFVYRGDNGGHGDDENWYDIGGHPDGALSDNGGHPIQIEESDNGGHQLSDTGGHGITPVSPVSTDATSNHAPQRASGGRAEGRPANGSALSEKSESRPIGHLPTQALDIAAEGNDQRPSNPYLAAKEGW